MRIVKAAVTSSLLLLAACSQPEQDRQLVGTVKLNCNAMGGVLGHSELIVDTEDWRLLHYEIESDTLKELTTSPGFRKGSEKTWTINKQDGILTITSREAFTDKYFEDRIEKSATAHANVKKYGWGAVMFTEEKLAAFDQFTKDRRGDYELIRTKINLKNMSAEIFEKRNWTFMNDSQATKSGRCDVFLTPIGAASSD
jgi:hypothetical protein